MQMPRYQGCGLDMWTALRSTVKTARCQIPTVDSDRDSIPISRGRTPGGPQGCCHNVDVPGARHHCASRLLGFERTARHEVQSDLRIAAAGPSRQTSTGIE